ncbi:hypothetical protein [Streptacidiphilus sp. EB129]|uniref:hypothetical protein n=1 Tax=Streptacidiphilus sp. EB129 TaxID=3156262 RepID=UPI003512B9C7
MNPGKGEAVLIARSYTRARRHPWVLGRVGDWTLPLGPYTPAQLVVAGVGVLALIETYGVWAPLLGPVPVFALGASVWAVRSVRIGGRVPAAALLGLVSALLQPRAGRIGGRTARDRAPAELFDGFYVTSTEVPATGFDGLSAPAAHTVRAVRAVRGPVAQLVAQTAQHQPVAVRSGSAGGPVVAPTVLQRLLAASSDHSVAAPVYRGVE